MTRILVTPALLLLFVAGMAIGALTAPGAGAAQYTYFLYVNPGASTNLLTCGWHDVCRHPYNWGNALDWGNDPYTNRYVYWRSWGVADSGSGTMAYAVPYDASSNQCWGAGAKTYDLAWRPQGSVVWIHTLLSPSAPTISIDGSWAGAFTSGGPMGTTVASEKSADCPWDDPHLHQYSTAAGWFANTDVYPPAPSGGTGYNLSAFGNWQNRTTWTN